MRKSLEKNTTRWLKFDRFYIFDFNFYRKITISSELWKKSSKYNFGLSRSREGGQATSLKNFGGRGCWSVAFFILLIWVTYLFIENFNSYDFSLKFWELLSFNRKNIRKWSKNVEQRGKSSWCCSTWGNINSASWLRVVNQFKLKLMLKIWISKIHH